MGFYFAGPDGKHDHADTVHVDRDCGHLVNSDGRVYPISYVPDEASVCGTCGPLEQESENGGDDSEDDSGDKDEETALPDDPDSPDGTLLEQDDAADG